MLGVSRFGFEPLLMEAYRKLTPTSRGKSKATVESLPVETLESSLVACRDIDLLARAEIRALQMVDGDNLINEISSIPRTSDR